MQQEDIFKSGSPFLFDKDNIIILLKLLTERKIKNEYIWMPLFKDVNGLIDDQELSLKEISLIQDCYYKNGAIEPNHQ